MFCRLLPCLLLLSCSPAPPAGAEPAPAPPAPRAPPASAAPSAFSPPSLPPTGAATLVQGRHVGSITSSAWSQGGALLATGAWDGSVRVWTATGELRQVLRGLTEDVEALAFSPDDSLLAGVSRNSNGRVWRVADGATLHELNEHEDSVESVVWFPAGDRLMTGSWDGDLRVWDAGSGRSLSTIAAHEEGIFALALAPDGRRAVSGSQDKTARVWDLETGEKVRDLMPHDDAVYCAAWSPGGERYATGGRDGRVFVYGGDARMVADLRLGEPVLSLRFVDEDTVEAAGWAGTGQRWTLSSGEPVEPPPAETLRTEHGALRVRGR